MGDIRFDTEPRDRRIYVLPEPEPPEAPPAVEPDLKLEMSPEPSELASSPSWRERRGGFQRWRAPVVVAPPVISSQDMLFRVLRRHNVGWIRLSTLAASANVSAKRAWIIMERAWRAGLVDRRVNRAFMLKSEREYRIRDEGVKSEVLPDNHQP